MKRKEALALLKKYGASEGVIQHVKKCATTPWRCGQNTSADRELVEAGALLHDIGRALSHGIDHAIIGARFCGKRRRRKHRPDRRKARGCRPDRRRSRLPGPAAEGYLPETIEEKIVCHADNLIGNRSRISIHEAIRTAKKWSPGALDRLIRMHFEVSAPRKLSWTDVSGRRRTRRRHRPAGRALPVQAGN